MTQTVKFIQRLEALKEGERSSLRRLGGQQLDGSVPGFDLFTGLWWPLRKRNQAAPRRETSWLVAKLYCARPMPYVGQKCTPAAPGEACSCARCPAPVRQKCASLPAVLGRCEPRNDFGRKRYRQRFDALLQSPLAALEPHLRWALSVVADAVTAGRVSGPDWAQLLDDVSSWDRGEEYRRRGDVREKWACQYLEASKPKGETGHAD